MSGAATASASSFVPASVRAFRFTGWSADWDAGAVDLRYSLADAHAFTESYRFPAPAEPLDAARRGALDRAARLLHLVAGISYYKAAVPPCIEIDGPLPSPETARFLGRLYTQGLGEFAWRNRLPGIGRGIVFPASEASAPARPARRPRGPLAGARRRRQGLGREPGRAASRR